MTETPAKYIVENHGVSSVRDNDRVSRTNLVHDTKTQKQQHLQRWLDRAEKDPVPHIETYSPGKRDTEYFRLTYRRGKKVIRTHIKGGSTIAELAQYRAKKLQQMIDRGAELEEIIAALKTFNGGKK